MLPENQPFEKKRVLVFGASGTIGQAVIRALVDADHEAVGFMRPTDDNRSTAMALEGYGASVRFGDATNPGSILNDAFSGEQFDAVVSCLASRTGSPEDADRIDLQANLDVLDIAEKAGVRHFILLSAICVQKPRLAFQHAKLRFERRLQVSGLTWSIVRPTAFFKSLSGQIERVRAGKPFLLFGDGQQTRCKPISDADLARYIVSCLDAPSKYKQILHIGGPGPAMSPKEQGAMLFELTGQAPRFRSVPVILFSVVASLLAPLGRLSGWAAVKAEYARIARYYATESMLVWDPEAQEYSADQTPEFGTETLRDHYRAMLEDKV